MTTLTSKRHPLAPSEDDAPVLADQLRSMEQQDGSLYAVVDAARAGEVLALLAQGDAPFASLYQGPALQRYMSVSPFLVRYRAQAAACRWLTTSAWGDSCGLLLTSRAPFEELVSHLASLVLVEDECGVADIFRFHDPRVLPLFLPTCRGPELDRFFGPVERLMVESETAAELLVFGREGPGDPAAGRLRLRPEQVDAMLLAAEGDFLERLHQHLQQHHPETCARMGEARVQQRIRHAVVEGFRRELHTERALADHVRLTFAKGVKDV